MGALGAEVGKICCNTAIEKLTQENTCGCETVCSTGGVGSSHIDKKALEETDCHG